MSDRNIARRLTEMARLDPDRPAVIAPSGHAISFAQLEERSTQLAAGLAAAGVRPGMKLVLFVPFSIEFVELTFAIFKTGAIVVLIDPGMGRANIFKCLNEVQPDGFVAVPIVHVIRWFAGGASRRTALNFCVGPWLPGITATYRQLIRTKADSFTARRSAATDSAAIIFTSGSTGPPKGVLYEHGMFDAQVDLIRDRYGIVPGDVDLPGFPLFGLFNSAMGVTTVIPDMDPTKPAKVDPEKILKAIRQHNVTQAFGSPAFWNRVGRYCAEQNLTLPTLKRALSAGGPVPGHVLQRMAKILTRPGADLFTPYGATESLPVSSIGAREILESTAPLTKQGAGTCVGTTFPGMRVKILPMTDGPIASIADVAELPPGEIGEIVVRGPSVTREYYQRTEKLTSPAIGASRSSSEDIVASNDKSPPHPLPLSPEYRGEGSLKTVSEATRLAKIPDSDGFWHRIGDVGYLDSTGRLWFCGRKAHVVVTPTETLFSVCCEAIFNEHPRIYRSALVGIGPRGQQRPAIVAEPESGQFPKTPADEQQLREELLALGQKHSHTQNIHDILFHPSLPVDTRHNVKINREALAHWAAPKLEEI